MTNYTEERLINARSNKTTFQYGKPISVESIEQIRDVAKAPCKTTNTGPVRGVSAWRCNRELINLSVVGCRCWLGRGGDKEIDILHINPRHFIL